MLSSLLRPVKPEDLDDKVCAEIAALLQQDPKRANAIGAAYQPTHWRELAEQLTLFLGRDEAGKLVAMGCVSIYPTFTNRIARIGEIFIDKDSRNESTERSIFARLLSRAASMGAISFEMDDRLCAVSEPILKEAGFYHRHKSHHWRHIIPSNENQ
jgi:hypothetical protein